MKFYKNYRDFKNSKIFPAQLFLNQSLTKQVGAHKTKQPTHQKKTCQQQINLQPEQDTFDQKRADYTNLPMNPQNSTTR